MSISTCSRCRHGDGRRERLGRGRGLRDRRLAWRDPPPLPAAGSEGGVGAHRRSRPSRGDAALGPELSLSSAMELQRLEPVGGGQTVPEQGTEGAAAAAHARQQGGAQLPGSACDRALRRRHPDAAVVRRLDRHEWPELLRLRLRRRNTRGALPAPGSQCFAPVGGIPRDRQRPLSERPGCNDSATARRWLLASRHDQRQRAPPSRALCRDRGRGDRAGRSMARAGAGVPGHRRPEPGPSRWSRGTAVSCARPQPHADLPFPGPPAISRRLLAASAESAGSG